MATKRKIKNTPPRGGNWQKLESVGDARRLLRWIILETKADKMDIKKSAVLGQLAIYILKATQADNLEQRISALEGRQTTPDKADKPEAEIVI